ncbi:MAG: hypothetical protein ACYTE5_00445 [Planctomycetota bacterium]|jgi:hypothetical protein
MQKKKCSHLWEMINIVRGLIVMKKCFHCGKVSTCFALHHEPPLEPCHEENHFWNFMESDESFHFDLKCTKCRTLVKLDELVGLMMCTGCDEACEVDVLRRKLEPECTRVCIAFGRRPIDERKQLSQEQLDTLQDYFTQQSKSLKCKIKIVPHEMVRNIASCYAEAIEDVESLFTVPSEKR